MNLVEKYIDLHTFDINKQIESCLISSKVTAVFTIDGLKYVVACSSAQVERKLEPLPEFQPYDYRLPPMRGLSTSVITLTLLIEPYLHNTIIDNSDGIFVQLYYQNQGNRGHANFIANCVKSTQLFSHSGYDNYFNDLLSVQMIFNTDSIPLE
ncbi:hypothetical protein [Bacillus cereus]|uniref:hypothetical protein n=1 Tax=Bacillus cereus TaxID=1396 RepID=UPI0003311D26|nr:hypothetical protein [Bacillus cereus]EOO44480.1 hypothetical protein ICK_06255 [Bacillus cereus BAG1X2-2]